MQEILYLGPKYPVRDKLKEIHFLAHVDIFVPIKKSERNRELLCEVEAVPEAFVRRVKQISSDRVVEKL